MEEGNLWTAVAVVLVAIAIGYQSTFLRQKKFLNLSLQQILMIVVVPGVLFPIVFSYVQTLASTPLASVIWVSDKVLVNLVLLSFLFMYGGIAIHGITKIVGDQIQIYGGPAEVKELNRFFHMNFSHNLSFGGVVVAGLGITLLEMNHVPDQLSTSLIWSVGRGLMLGVALALAVYNYTRHSTGDSGGRWYDLRFFFVILWLATVVMIYNLRKVYSNLTEYQLLLPAMLSLSVMLALNIVLVVRRVRRGWRVYVSQKRLRRLMNFWEA